MESSAWADWDPPREPQRCDTKVSEEPEEDRKVAAPVPARVPAASVARPSARPPVVRQTGRVRRAVTAPLSDLDARARVQILEAAICAAATVAITAIVTLGVFATLSVTLFAAVVVAIA